MKLADIPGVESLPALLAYHINRVCDCQEAAWRAGRRPRIEDFVTLEEEPGRSVLLRELLAAELAARQRRGETPDGQEYRDRFPGDAGLIDALFAEAQRLTERPATPGPTRPVDARANPPNRGDRIPRAGRGASDPPGDPRASESGEAIPIPTHDDPTHPGGDPAGSGSFAAPPHPAGDPARRFRILRRHVRGGLGEIFIAFDKELRRQVALKEIRPEHAGQAQSQARFLLEAEITGGLEHPGIVPIYGLGRHADGRPYYAMRFVQGQTLKEAIAQFHGAERPHRDPGERSLALHQLLRRFVDVCNALAYAHSRGVLHRDLKPANILLGPFGETLIVDWGLAKPMDRPQDARDGSVSALRPSLAGDSTLTQTGAALGSPGYMSPEQAAGRPDRLGPASDVYSLGATLYCVLTGRAPIEERDIDKALQKARDGDFPPPRQVHGEVDAALEAIGLKAMAREPAARYPSALALAADLEHWLADEPVSAWREPLSRRARRWALRHRTVVTAAAAAVLVALAGTAAVLAVQTRANRELRHANTALEEANRRERQRFDLAVEAIQRYHTGVSEDFLLKQDQFKELRDRLLRDAVGFYRKLEGLLSGQADVRSRRTLGRAYVEVGELTDKIGSVLEALATHRKALEVRRALAREATSDSDTKADVGRSLIAIGGLLGKVGRYEEALASYEEAHSVLRGLAGPGPGRDVILGDLARGRYRAGWLLYQSGRIHEAMAAFEEARAIEAELAAAHPEDVDDQRLLSWCYNDIGNLLVFEGKTSEGLAAFEASRRIKQKVADDHPDVAEYRSDLAITQSNFGTILRETGRSAEALIVHQEAVAVLEALVDAYPAVIVFQGDLANYLNETGDDLRLIGRTAEAQAFFERAIVILDGLVKANPRYTEIEEHLVQGLRGLGATQLAGGRVDDAVANWRRAVAIGERLHYNYCETLLNLASCHALLGGIAGAPGSGLSAEEGQAERDRAMEALRRAVAAGFRTVTWLRRDPDLNSLRTRPDFQLLLLDLDFPSDPFSKDTDADR
jgi:serine/threonine-protein kinase